MKTNQKPTPLSLVISAEQVQAQLLASARCAAIELATSLIQEEVTKLCGDPFCHKGEMLCHRGGSQRGFLQLQGSKYHFDRPRVRRGDNEVKLSSYEALKGQDLLDDTMLEKMMGGVSTRQYEEIIDGFAERFNVSKSSVSRAFTKASKKHLDQLNGSDLSEHRFVAMMIDGVEFAGRSIICALGVTAQGDKITLGLKEGASENTEVVKDLLTSIRDRGFTSAAACFLVALDGGKALKSGLTQVFGEQAVIVRCYLHKIRNIEGYLPKPYHSQLRRRFKKLMGLVSYEEAAAELVTLQKWLSNISLEAEKSLNEAGDELLTTHRLRLPAKLRRSFASTNMIESLFSVVRRKTNRVTRWKGKDQRLRWAATAILSHEKKAYRLRGSKEIPVLIAALNKIADGHDVSYKPCAASPS